MDGFLDLLGDNDSALGRSVTTAVLVALAVPLGAVLGRLVARRGSDAYGRYYLRKAAAPSRSRTVDCSRSCGARLQDASEWSWGWQQPASRLRCRRSLARWRDG